MRSRPNSSADRLAGGDARRHQRRRLRPRRAPAWPDRARARWWRARSCSRRWRLRACRNSSAPSSTRSAPEAITRAFSFGQPCRGLTRRSRDSPKFAMARAAAPIFSPSCGSTRMTIGAGCYDPVLGLVGSRRRACGSTSADGSVSRQRTGAGQRIRLSPPPRGCYSGAAGPCAQDAPPAFRATH